MKKKKNDRVVFDGCVLQSSRRESDNVCRAFTLAWWRARPADTHANQTHKYQTSIQFSFLSARFSSFLLLLLLAFDVYINCRAHFAHTSRLFQTVYGRTHFYCIQNALSAAGLLACLPPITTGFDSVRGQFFVLSIGHRVEIDEDAGLIYSIIYSTIAFDRPNWQPQK